jgi:hypothetical protein
MTQLDRLDGAFARFSAALDRLETAAARRFEAESSFADIEEELAVMRDDRGRLALELDAALARASALEKTREEVLRRLDNASAEVRATLGAAPAGGE